MDVKLPYFGDADVRERKQPSAAECMASLTLEISTNLDLAAEARSRPRGDARPDAKEFVRDEDAVPGNPAPAGAEPEDVPLLGLELSHQSKMKN